MTRPAPPCPAPASARPWTSAWPALVGAVVSCGLLLACGSDAGAGGSSGATGPLAVEAARAQCRGEAPYPWFSRLPSGAIVGHGAPGAIDSVLDCPLAARDLELARAQELVRADLERRHAGPEGEGGAALTAREPARRDGAVVVELGLQAVREGAPIEPIGLEYRLAPGTLRIVSSPEDARLAAY